MEKNILNIYCPSCGAPAEFDIVHQLYRCRYCGGKVTLEAARETGKSFTRRQKRHAEGYALEYTACTGCGATVVFAENEALSKCEFCGRSLVRKRYTGDERLPRYVIPFGLTCEEAADKLRAWCEENSGKPEAKRLKEKLPELKGYYLPYEIVRGPVSCTVNKHSEYVKFEGKGYLFNTFINCSEQLDNLLLDAMEPYDTEALRDFDFAFVAGHRVKIPDLENEAVTERLRQEADANYRAYMEKIWGTRAIDTETSVKPVVRLPALLPVYFIADGAVKAAVNGQTGKISVAAEKPGSYLTLPWWLKGIAILLLAMGLTLGGLCLGGTDFRESLFITGLLGIFYLIVFLCMLSDGGSTSFGIEYYRRIFTSGGQILCRGEGKPGKSAEALRGSAAEPVFLRLLDGKTQEVTYSFRTPRRVIGMIVLSAVTMFFPVIIALFVNGFDFARLDLRGSAVWFCLAIPLVPIYLIRFGIQWLYENPRVYVIDKEGKRRRYRHTSEVPLKKRVKEGLKVILGLLFVPPYCFITWLVIASLITMVYLTAFGL